MLLWSLLISLIGAVLAYLRRDLTADGFWGALAVGTITAGFGGWTWFAVLAAFFISSSLLTSFKGNQKRQIEKQFSKTRPRDLGQVLANGGLAALLAVMFAASNQRPVFFVVFLGVMATANADTWATELGVLSRGRVWAIWGGRRVARGTSGGVSLLGTLAGLAGALTIGIVGGVGDFLSQDLTLPMRYSILAAASGGFLGCLIDSLLGATLQARFKCSWCGQVTEKSNHCGGSGEIAGGWPWLDNDLVNAISSFLGGVIAVLTLYLYLTFSGFQLW